MSVKGDEIIPVDRSKGLENIIIKQDWEESERGWGTRPDGCTLHKTLADCKNYIDNYWEGMPEETPDEYDRPCGKPYLVLTSSDLYTKVLASNLGLRFWGSEERELTKNKEITKYQR